MGLLSGRWHACGKGRDTPFTNIMVRLRVEPDGKEGSFYPGIPLIRALWELGVPCETPCGGFGLCGKCKVQFVNGAPPLTVEEERHLTLSEREQGWRLACRQFLSQDGIVFVPEASRPTISAVLTEAVERPVALEPSVRAVELVLSPPTQQDERGHLVRLLEGLERVCPLRLSADSVPLAVIRQLPQILNSSQFKVSVILHQQEANLETKVQVLTVRPIWEKRPILGLALDIGTTTLVGYLLNLETGEQIACSSRLNPQVRYGDDVISRLCFALQEPNGLRELQKAVVSGINEIIAESCLLAGVSESDIYETVVVGNTAMLHLFLGVSPESIAFAPYVPVFQDSLTIEAWRVGLRIHPMGLVTTLPCIAGYVGADTTAVVLTHLYDLQGESAIALDIGTNGEVVVRHRGRYLCSSAAAGPAFEGGRIYQGMRADTGAIVAVSYESKDGANWFRVATVGGGLPIGLCGSGLIDAVAALLQAKITDESGYLGGSQLPAELSCRLIHLNGQRAFQLVTPEASGRPDGIVLTQKDIRELQLAKGSIRAVTEVLAKTAGLSWDEVAVFYTAGAFGMFVNPVSAARIGLLPPIPLHKVMPVGNAAGAGAKLTLRSLSERKKARQLAFAMEHIPMTQNQAYQEALMEFLGFPPLTG
ncbi:MAG: ASKHA domain-containing protein [Armatimonadetes bacterium]|nr:ASKHA domain-containing protein [Armatimonadota bacterium]MDW8122749.1 ASKHA domain-containing protein [Armatimonadota bacterium]